ncbi:Uncharacterised protein [Mycobacterium tuberculosis]|nr:Uncharacterised protein [Mycobacterium tuberculosis]
MKHIVKFDPPFDQVLNQILPGLAQGGSQILRHPQQELAVAHLILHLGHNAQFPLQGGSLGHPLFLRKGSHDLADTVHMDQFK